MQGIKKTNFNLFDKMIYICDIKILYHENSIIEN